STTTTSEAIAKSAGGDAQSRRRTPWLMALLSFFLPGCGQMICGQKDKGATFLAVAVLGHVCSGGMTDLFLCPFMALDAWTITKKFNEAGAVLEWEFCPTIPEINQV